MSQQSSPGGPWSSVEEAQDLATGVLAPGLLVVHDAEGSAQDQVAELSRGQDINSPALKLVQGDIKARGDHTALVQAASQLV